MKKIALLLPFPETGGIRRTANTVLFHAEKVATVRVVTLGKKHSLLAKCQFLFQALSAIRHSDLVISLHINLLFPAFLFSGKPMYVFMHGIELWSPRRFPKHWNYVVNSRMNYFYLKGFDTDLRVSQVYYPGLGNANVISRPEKTAGDSIRFLLVSRISRSESYKNIDGCLTVFHGLLDHQVPVSLLVAGDGDGAEARRDRFQRPGIHFSGLVPDAQLRDYYLQADVFLLISSHEGQGIVFLEAMEHGLPILALKQSAAEEFVTHGENGFLVENAENELREAILQFVDNPKLLSEFGRNSKEKSVRLAVEQRFEQFIRKLSGS